MWLGSTSRRCRASCPAGPDDPLWWTLRRPFRPLAYHAARMMFDRANAASAPGGRCIPCVIPRPTASPVIQAFPISDVQWVFGHQSLATAQNLRRSRRRRTSSRARWPITGQRRSRRPGPPGPGPWFPSREPGRAVREGPLVTAAVVRQGDCPGLAAQRRGTRSDGEVPAPPGPGCPWDATAAGRSAVVRRMLAPPFPAGAQKSPGRSRKLAMLKILDWLELHPGDNVAGTLGRVRPQGLRRGPPTGGTGCWPAWRPPGKLGRRAKARSATY